jgi:hypothetical protein
MNMIGIALAFRVVLDISAGVGSLIQKPSMNEYGVRLPRLRSLVKVKNPHLTPSFQQRMNR